MNIIYCHIFITVFVRMGPRVGLFAGQVNLAHNLRKLLILTPAEGASVLTRNVHKSYRKRWDVTQTARGDGESAIRLDTILHDVVMLIKWSNVGLKRWGDSTPSSSPSFSSTPPSYCATFFPFPPPLRSRLLM